jgi:hypothetical protein
MPQQIHTVSQPWILVVMRQAYTLRMPGGLSLSFAQPGLLT